MLPSAAKHRQQRTFQARHVQWTKINRQELACPAQCRWLLSTNTSWSQQCREMLMGYLKWTWKSKTNNEPKISRNTRRWNLRYRQLNFKNVGETREATHYSLSWVWAVKKKRGSCSFFRRNVDGSAGTGNFAMNVLVDPNYTPVLWYGKVHFTTTCTIAEKTSLLIPFNIKWYKRTTKP